MLYHNHQIGPTIAKHYPSSRRLITTECQGALNLLEVGGNTTLVHRELLCKRESRDTSAVAVFEWSPSGELTVSHVPRLILAICSIFIRQGGILVCVVTGARHYSIDLPQGGSEIPCNHIFRTNNQAKSDKAKSQFRQCLKLQLNQY